MELMNWPIKCIEPGEKYGRLTVISTHKIVGSYRYLAKCQCDCGSNPIYVRTDALRKTEKGSRKPTKSCGCLHKEMVITHGAYNNPLFRVWSAMHSRCYNPKDKRYARYGGRGIIVCDRWHDINAFIEDMQDGYHKDLQIDRIDNDRGYYKANCQWVTAIEQAFNKSDTVQVTFNGQSRSIRQWAIHLGINYGTLVERIRVLHWPIEKALTHPVRKGNYKRKG